MTDINLKENDYVYINILNPKDYSKSYNQFNGAILQIKQFILDSSNSISYFKIVSGYPTYSSNMLFPIRWAKKTEPFNVGERVLINKPYDIDTSPGWYDNNLDGKVSKIDHLEDNNSICTVECHLLYLNTAWLRRLDFCYTSKNIEYRKSIDGFDTNDKNWENGLDLI